MEIAAQAKGRRYGSTGTTAARAMFDVMGAQRNAAGELVDRIPPERFGKEKARILRKGVLLAIAASADPDGTNAYPSRETIARRCLVTARAVDKSLKWLVEHGLLRVEFKAGRAGKLGRTNRYTILFPDGNEASTAFGKADVPEDGEMTGHHARPAPETGEAPRTTALGRRTTEVSTVNNEHQHGEQFARGPGTSITPNRPSNRPINRPGDQSIAAPGSDEINAPEFRSLMDELTAISGYDMIFSPAEAGLLAKMFNGHDKADILTAYRHFHGQLDDYSTKFAVRDWLAKGAGYIRAAELERAAQAKAREEQRKLALQCGCVECDDGKFRSESDCVQGPDGIWRERPSERYHPQRSPAEGLRQSISDPAPEPREQAPPSE